MADDLVTITEPIIGLLKAAGVPMQDERSSGNNGKLIVRVPEWAAIVGNAMLAAIMLTSESEVVDMIRQVGENQQLQQSVIGSSRCGIKPMDLYLMLRGEMSDE